MAAKTRLGVVFGGRSVEHEVSVMSAMDVISAADPDRFDVVPFGVTRDGRWLTPEETRVQLARPDAPFEKRLDADVPQLLERREVLGELRHVDVVFPLVHGAYGEDGTLQGMLEMFGLPYCGCGVAASAVGMDKALQKKLFSAAGLKVARYLTVREHEWQHGGEAIARGVESDLGYPAFVKPSNGGSSVGVSKVRSREDLGEAMRSAFALDRKILVEEAIVGREVDCGVRRQRRAGGVAGRRGHPGGRVLRLLREVPRRDGADSGAGRTVARTHSGRARRRRARLPRDRRCRIRPH